MRIFVKLILIIAGIAGAFVVYIVGKDTFARNDSVFLTGVTYYNNGNYVAAEQFFQQEEMQGNKNVYPYLGHIKLLQNKPKEAENYLLLALEELNVIQDTVIKQNVLLNLGSVYLNLEDDIRAKQYLIEAYNHGSKEAMTLMIKYNLN